MSIRSKVKKKKWHTLPQLQSTNKAHKSKRKSGSDIKLAETILPTLASPPLKVMLKNVGKMTPEGITTKDDKTTMSTALAKGTEVDKIV